MKSGKLTLGEISAKYNIGRARLDAIRKLKEIEEEFKRQVSSRIFSSHTPALFRMKQIDINLRS